jgi:uncharacterized membrane protein
MARSYDDVPPDEGPGLVSRLLRTGVAAPNVAMKVLADQVAGWKKDFLGIFQAEIRRFLDRQNPGADLEKILKGKRLEVSVRLVDDDGPVVSKPDRPAAPAKKARSKKRS